MYIPEVPPPTTTTSQDMGRKEDSLNQQTNKQKSRQSHDRTSLKNNNSNNTRTLVCNTPKIIFLLGTLGKIAPYFILTHVRSSYVVTPDAKEFFVKKKKT